MEKKMKRENLWVIIGLMTFALVGLVLLQFYWVDNALLVQERYFNLGVNRAMNESAKKIEKYYAAEFLKQQMNTPVPPAPPKHVNAHVKVYKSPDGKTQVVELKSDTSAAGYRRSSRIEAWQRYSTQDNRKFNEALYGQDFSEMFQGNALPAESGNLLQKAIDSLKEWSDGLNALQGLFLDFAEEKSVSELLDVKILDKVLREELVNQGISTRYTFGVYHAGLGRMELSNDEETTDELFGSPYKLQLFSGKIVPRSEYLILYFPNKSNFLFRKMSLVLSSSAVLLALIVFCFSFTILTIFRQKKISEMKTDFINNMTHEFKTPVSTILLASEALQDSKIIEEPQRLKKMAEIIHYENSRIGSHVERVLQLAAMEKGNFKLNLEVLDAHEQIKKVIEGISIQVEKRGGTITTDLAAAETEIYADQLHFSNVIYNLLDNAIKYCQTEPQIEVYTSSTKGYISISIKDNGIGLSREAQNKIFEQFYRVHTGNIHDVKGFGLGLHYVKTITELHGGLVGVSSEKGRGSVFEIKIPLNLQA